MGDPLFPERIETDRLVMEPLTTEYVDLFAFYRICSSDDGIEAVTEYVTWDPHETVQETREFLHRVAEDREAGESAQYVIRLAPGEDGAGDVAGATGFSVDWDRRTANLGVWLRRRFWGRGYSGERAAALLSVCFERLDLDLVAVTHVDGNENSRRAIEKYVSAHGGQYDGVLRNWDVSGETPRDLHRFTITNDQYREAL